MSFRHDLVRRTGCHGARGQSTSVLAVLHRPDTREAEGRPYLSRKRRPPATVVLPPLIEAVGYGEATMATKIDG